MPSKNILSKNIQKYIVIIPQSNVICIPVDLYVLVKPGHWNKIDLHLQVLIGPPDKIQRLHILTSKVSSMPVDSDLDLDTVAMVTNGYVGADLAAVCQEAAYIAIAESQGCQEYKLVGKTGAILIIPLLK